MRRLGFIDVTLRDGHQCLWATRMTSAMMAPILSTIDRAGYDCINILGGAVFDVCVRYLHENPWRRVEMLCRRLQTPTDGFLRGQSDEIRKYALGYYGRLAATPSKEFLERAELEPGVLASERAGTHIEAWVPRLRKELGPGADDEDILMAAFYDKEILAPLEKQSAKSHSYRTSPLMELIQYVGLKPDFGRVRIRFAGAELQVAR